MRSRLDLIAFAALLPFTMAVAAQSPLIEPCVEPLVTSSGYVLAPQCSSKPLAALFDQDRYSPELLPPIGSASSRRDQFRIYERRIPGTEIVVTPSPLRNQWMYRPDQVGPGAQFPSSPREVASDFVFGVRVPF